MDLRPSVRRQDLDERRHRACSPASSRRSELAVGGGEDPGQLGRLGRLERLRVVVGPDPGDPLAGHLDRIAVAAVLGAARGSGRA